VEGRDPNWVTELRTSLFCLAPTGGGWGIRLYVAVFHGCIPVIVQDDVYPPFHQHLPYSQFAVRGLSLIVSRTASPHRVSQLCTPSLCLPHRLSYGVSRRAGDGETIHAAPLAGAAAGAGGGRSARGADATDARVRERLPAVGVQRASARRAGRRAAAASARRESFRPPAPHAVCRLTARRLEPRAIQLGSQ
jgi:hypothetical protein